MGSLNIFDVFASTYMISNEYSYNMYKIFTAVVLVSVSVETVFQGTNFYFQPLTRSKCRYRRSKFTVILFFMKIVTVLH